MAAGLGFKTFLSGDVLSAADTNGYLMQGVLVFASAAARDAAITSPQEGQYAYLKDTNITYYYSGSAWVSASSSSPLTTKGDVYTFSTVDARLAVGANNTVLTADSAQATGLKWAASSSATGWTLLNAGGTALTGAATITVSGLSAKELQVIVIGASSANATSSITLRLNGDSAANYTWAGFYNACPVTYNSGNIQGDGSYSGATSFLIGRMAADVASTVFGSAIIDLADTTGWKSVDIVGGGDLSAGSQIVTARQGIYEASAAITSISIISSSGNFDAGTVYVMGAN